MKRYVIGMMALIIAVSVSGFVNYKPNSRLQYYFYIQTTPYSYEYIDYAPSSANCYDSSDFKCWLMYDSFKGDNFSAFDIPYDYVERATVNGLYSKE